MRSHEIARDFLEFASEQRLEIIFRLFAKKSKVSVIAKELGATVPEVFRNFERLVKAELIEKDTDGSYHLTVYGMTVCNQIPSLAFVAANKKYFKNHDFGDLPQKYIQRIGALEQNQHIKGFTKVMERWKNIIENANEYIYGILLEEPLDLLEPIANKAKKDVKINSIFSESTIVPKGRKQLIDKLDFKTLTKNGLVERKMRKDVKIGVFLSEHEACVMFPTLDDEADISEMFYSQDKAFHEWCLDYFRYCWYGSEAFKESKLKE
ncbi:MAG TPA: transcriptional regulator [Nitrosopumilaceae archaeon]|nr:transcriptional regulator [Nitrosopumilaceae archaeon]